MSLRDVDRLRGVHEDLVEVLEEAFADFDDEFADFPGLEMFVIEGLRTRERQATYLRNGASQTMNSRHLTGHAVDLGLKDGEVMRWEFPLYRQLAENLILPISREIDVPITWGGSWKSRDGPHFELSWGRYGSKGEGR